jgi:D-xylose transport system permease protein
MTIPTESENPSIPQPLGDEKFHPRKVLAHDLSSLFVVLGIGLVWIVFETQDNVFLTSRNLSNLMLQMAVVAVLAIAVTLVMILGEIDLSLGSVTGVTSAFLGVLLTNRHWPFVSALIATLFLGLVIGLFQGAITVLVGVPSFLVTLGGFLTWAGVQYAMVGSAGQLPVINSTLAAVGNSYISQPVAWIGSSLIVLIVTFTEFARVNERRRAGIESPFTPSLVRVLIVGVVLIATVSYLNSNFGVPFVLVLFLGISISLGWVTQRTQFGRDIYAIGGSAEASRRAGIPVGHVRIMVLGISGLLAGVAGVISTSNLYSTSSNIGGGLLLLESIAAAVIGGTSLFGGRGRIYNALLGALLVASIENGLGLLGEPISTQQIATGAILVIAVSIDAVSRRRRAASGR